MATVQKTISESGSLTTKTLVTTISAPGIRQDAVVSVSPNIDASKVSYVINEAAGTITVTLANVGYTSQSQTSNWQSLVREQYTDLGSQVGLMSVYCEYDGGGIVSMGAVEYSYRCPFSKNFASTYYYFNYTVTVIYKTFPEFKVRQSGQLKTAADGWVRANGQLKQIQQIWVRENGQLKEV